MKTKGMDKNLYVYYLIGTLQMHSLSHESGAVITPLSSQAHGLQSGNPL